MSFILDAIAKSERERQQQLAPDASRLAIPVGATATRSHKGIYLIVGVLLLNAALILLWFQWQEPDAVSVAESSDVGVVTRTDVADSDQPSVEPQPTPAAVVLAETPKPERKFEPADTQPAESSARVTPSVVKATQVTTTAPVEKSVDTIIIESPVETARTESVIQQDTNTSSNQVALTTDSGGSSAEVQPLVDDALSQPELPPQPEPPPRKISRLSDLPDDVRDALPSMVFTGHLYSSNPRARYVFIGDRQIVAGQRIADDLVLDSITPTGVVVEFHQYLIEVGVLQNWSLN